jgi:hypothetical protein
MSTHGDKCIKVDRMHSMILVSHGTKLFEQWMYALPCASLYICCHEHNIKHGYSIDQMDCVHMN